MRIGVLTGGGDCPGLNAVIRAVVRRGLQLASIQRTLPATLPVDRAKPFGWQEPSAWASFASWMFAHRLLAHEPKAGLPPFTNEFLPGQGI